MKPRRGTIYNPATRNGTKVPAPEGKRGGRFAPVDVTRPYLYGASTPESRPEIPPAESADRPAVEQRPALSALTPKQRWKAMGLRQHRARMSKRLAERVRAVIEMVEPPAFGQAADAPTLKDELEYIGTVAEEMRIELEAFGCVDQGNAETLLRAAESMYALATLIPVVADDTAA